MEHPSFESLYHWKVGQPNVSNNIVQMRSGGFQPPFIAGGNQTAYYLGLKSNAETSLVPHEPIYSATERLIKEHARK